MFHHQQLIHDLDLCLSTQEYTDVTLSCGEKEFQCHKLILASRSPVFRTMFEEVMKRKESGKIEIKDEKVEVIEEVLKYIYTGTAPNIDTLGKGKKMDSSIFDCVVRTSGALESIFFFKNMF